MFFIRAGLQRWFSRGSLRCWFAVLKIFALWAGFVEDSLNSKVRAYLELFGFAGLIIAFDQYTKWLVRSNLAFGEVWAPWDWLIAYARIYHVKNTGAAFGMFQDGNLIFMILAVVVSVVIIYYFPLMLREDWPVRVALVLQFAGAVGNLIDRIHQGHVTDFISVGNFFVFNVADSSISIGVAVLIVGMLVKEYQDRQQAKLQQAPAEDEPAAEEAAPEPDVLESAPDQAASPTDDQPAPANSGETEESNA